MGAICVKEKYKANYPQQNDSKNVNPRSKSY